MLYIIIVLTIQVRILFGKATYFTYLVSVPLVLTTASVLLFLTYTVAMASHRPMVRVAVNHSQLSENILYVLRDRCTQLAVDERQ